MALLSLSRLYTKLLILGSTLTFLLLLYTLSLSSIKSLTSSLNIGSSSESYSCSPQSYSAGQWSYKPRTNSTALVHPMDTLTFAGFQGCASNREVYWHLGVGPTRDNENEGVDGVGKGMWDRFPVVSSWKWETEEGCNMRPFDAEELVRSLVEDGGWLLIGDSMTESEPLLLPLLPPLPTRHRYPDYVKNPYFDRAWPQHLYLNPESCPEWTPLRYPPGFNITSTPLVTFRRVDLLLSKEELEGLYETSTPHRRQYPPTPQHRRQSEPELPSSPRAKRPLFTEETIWTLSPSIYLRSLFLSPLPEANYATMIVSTAGHWTAPGLFGAFDNTSSTTEGENNSTSKDGEDADPGGIDALIPFFGEAMEMWADSVQEDLDRDEGVVLGGYRFFRPHRSTPLRAKRQVLVRAYLPGHEDCHSYRRPWDEMPANPWVWGWYNWPVLSSLLTNALLCVTQDLLQNRNKYPNIHYLGIDRPARLRPDAHATGDCLHIMTGAGVLEGWSEYIWHWVSSERS
ncbi:hypothetical protein BT96DRAFT_1081005 [Gymnopus androsaceus JB14]|uniref:Uncharacterized protein n=1 Tax=Gymnopus androsaceus JB14 TaxID=1447944 RepID=A0A6A4GPB1_9AGAR|nr:hypothetical protein BT96DRAFT_1081005 [Gymnopus androsaceus JB14]